jgi:predicted small lipoprotein YifL
MNRLLIVCIFATWLAACGQTGDLYLPDQPPPKSRIPNPLSTEDQQTEDQQTEESKRKQEETPSEAPKELPPPPP